MNNNETEQVDLVAQAIAEVMETRTTKVIQLESELAITMRQRDALVYDLLEARKQLAKFEKEKAEIVEPVESEWNPDRTKAPYNTWIEVQTSKGNWIIQYSTRRAMWHYLDKSKFDEVFDYWRPWTGGETE